MGIFRKKGRYARKSSSKNHSGLLIFISIVLVALLVAAVFIIGILNDDDQFTKEPTEFVEQETEYIEEGEYITINDPLLGTIEIEAVEGFAKNTYVNENFVMDESGKMTYYIENEVASCMGIDLSEYQGVVDFEKLKEQGFEFVILRIGGRYYSESGAMYVDTNFHQYYKAARDAGLKVGGYFFSQAKNAQEAIEEAEFAMNSIRGMKFDYPVAFDWETIDDDTARTDDVSGEDLTQAAIAFCDYMNEEGFKSIIYTNTYLMYYKYDLEQLKNYEFWIADYENLPSMYYHFTMWQYSKSGQVDGIEGNVDMNICMKNY